jgi:hypothetical protein
MCRVTGGLAYRVYSTRHLQLSVDALIAHMQHPSVCVRLVKIGPFEPTNGDQKVDLKNGTVLKVDKSERESPPPMDGANDERKELEDVEWKNVLQTVFVKGRAYHWPMPEAFWPTNQLQRLVN